MARHIVSIVGRRMEAVIEVDADDEAAAIREAAERAKTLSEQDWHMTDMPEVSGVERIYSAAEQKTGGNAIKAW